MDKENGRFLGDQDQTDSGSETGEEKAPYWTSEQMNSANNLACINMRDISGHWKRLRNTEGMRGES